MTDLCLDPDARRQLDEHGLWAFWRDHPSGRGRQGFAGLLLACTAEGCRCHTLFLEGVWIDDRMACIELDGDRLRIIGRGRPDDDRPLAPGVHYLRWDARTGALEPLHGDAEGLQDVARWLHAEVDDELRAALHRIVAAQRRDAQPDPGLWRSWRAGDMVHHVDHFPNHVFAGLRSDGVTYRLDDLHCVTPGCECADVRFVVHRIRADDEVLDDDDEEDDEALPVGSVRIRLPDPHPYEVSIDGRYLRSRHALLHLWTRFVARHPQLMADLHHRRAQLRRLRPPALLASAPEGSPHRPCILAMPRRAAARYRGEEATGDASDAGDVRSDETGLDGAGEGGAQQEGDR
ncbi:MAG: hypothetical protein H6835_05190 [Planctomycetes bacterium]|nr:hypothetical protein [Planctomycetota bacterium]